MLKPCHQGQGFSRPGKEAETKCMTHVFGFYFSIAFDLLENTSPVFSKINKQINKNMMPPPPCFTIGLVFFFKQEAFF